MNDPAVLLYTSDFLTGVIDMTMEERGQYITLLCYQHQKGHISSETIRLLVGSCSVSVLSHFKIDENGKYFNSRMDKEIEARRKFTESRRENGKKGGRPRKPIGYPNGKPTGKATTNHMGNEDEDVINNINNNISNNLFEFIEKEFGRTFSPTELELISTWEDNELTRHAIKETVLARATTLKYTQSILESYKAKGFKTLADVEADEKKYLEKKKERTNNYRKSDLERQREILEEFRNA